MKTSLNRSAASENPSREAQQSGMGEALAPRESLTRKILLQHVYKDEITKEFDLKMWVYVLKNFDVKKIIALFTPK
ncbi:hypothetical protein M5K25_000241 [Dendrobium thyrsiflorum]|uniref:Uncharacterized protein n=1 Tax=Dendrobium thyrsiflorum TaxID=117978 RepID=A0ABD0VTD5_DENTH